MHALPFLWCAHPHPVLVQLLLPTGLHLHPHRLNFRHFFQPMPVLGCRPEATWCFRLQALSSMTALDTSLHTACRQSSRGSSACCSSSNAGTFTTVSTFAAASTGNCTWIRSFHIAAPTSDPAQADSSNSSISSSLASNTVRSCFSETVVLDWLLCIQI